MADSRSVSSGNSYASGLASGYSKVTKPSDRHKDRKTLALSMLPSFIQGLSIVNPQYERQNSHKISTPEENSPTMLASESFQKLTTERKNERSNVKKRLEYEPLDESDHSLILRQTHFFDQIAAENRDKHVLKFANVTLTAQELIDFRDNREISRNFIDYCLGIFQKVNKDQLIKEKNCSKTLISGTSFAWRIFNKQDFKELHFHDFCFEYSVIIFPIFVEYWSLLLIWRDEHKVFYFQTGDKGNVYLKSILTSCYKFLLQEFNHFNKSQDIMKNLNTITYEKTLNRSLFSDNQSGLYTLMVAKLLCTGTETNLHELSTKIQDIPVDEFKYELIELILKESEEI